MRVLKKWDIRVCLTAALNLHSTSSSFMCPSGVAVLAPRNHLWASGDLAGRVAMMTRIAPGKCRIGPRCKFPKRVVLRGEWFTEEPLPYRSRRSIPRNPRGSAGTKRAVMRPGESLAGRSINWPRVKPRAYGCILADKFTYSERYTRTNV